MSNADRTASAVMTLSQNCTADTSRVTRRQRISQIMRHPPFAARRANGQSLVILALVLPFFIGVVMTAIEIGTRYLEVAELEDALRQASRSSVQLLDYAALAANGQRVDEGRVIDSARTMFRVNLASVRGLDEPVDALVDRVQWQVLETGGTCTLPGEGALVAGQAYRTNSQWQVTFSTPAVCATVRPKLRGLLGWGQYTPTINAAETLDRITLP
jgi:Flp pilus assembly protein TadG